MKFIGPILMILTLACGRKDSNSQGENFNQNVNKVAPNIVDDSDQLRFFDNPRNHIPTLFNRFPSGSVKPKGWILTMMHQDLQSGVVGALDELYPGIKADDLYNTSRRGGLEDVPEMGDLKLTGAEWEQSIMWWNAETIGNWWDGFIRHAFLTNDAKAIEQSHRIIDNLLESQDEDGYIGIYKPNLRYQHEGSNGELWAQTTAFRAMLAYFEFTGRAEVLKSVMKAMDVTMAQYGKEGRNPFYLKNAFGGVTHGLMLTDVCETLYRITGDQQYQDYATYLYRAFSTYSINRSFNDLRYPFLKEKNDMFEGHGVHTYEHIRTLTNAYYDTGYPELKSAYENMLFKLKPCILPSGAGHADEWIAKLTADPEKTAGEYCSMLELRNSHGSLIEKTGRIEFADAAEILTYNGMLGARAPNGMALTYSKLDNSYTIEGRRREGRTTKEDPRYKYSPTHSEPAVCCVPNYSRNLPYFLEQMWVRSDDGIALIMYGPSQVITEIDGTKVSIEQNTNYPFSDQVILNFKTEQPVNFSVRLRKPAWTKHMHIANYEIKETDGFYHITREWNDGDQVVITFNNTVERKSSFNDQLYLQRGPLVYALAIPHKTKTIKVYEGTEFTDYYCLATENRHESLAFMDYQFDFQSSIKDEFPWYNEKTYLTGKMMNTISKKSEQVKLIPLGSTVLRRVTFPVN